jgi:hypothetical protein
LIFVNLTTLDGLYFYYILKSNKTKIWTKNHTKLNMVLINNLPIDKDSTYKIG